MRALTGFAEYRCRGFVKVFSSVSSFLSTRPDINPEQYVRAQINWVISKNIEGGIIPSILSGEKALERYKLSGSQSANEQRVGAMLKWEYETWVNLVQQLGVDLALTNPVRSSTPLFLAYMHHLLDLEYPPDLADDAGQQLAAEPAYRQVFSADFLRTLT